MKNIRRVMVLLFTLFVSFVFIPVAFAHPLGNFTINHYAGLLVTREAVTVDYVLDMAEIPAFQEIAAFDANGNGQPDINETQKYHSAKCASLRSELDLNLNQNSATLTLTSSSIEFPPGAGGLVTLRLTCTFTAPVTSTITSISFADHSYSERIGWREIVVSSNGASLKGDLSGHTKSISNRLTAYPKDMLTSPLDQRQISFDVDLTAISTSSSQPVTQQTTPLTANRNDAFTQLITLKNLTLPTILLAILISFVWGAMHAMTPGHGKTIVAAYLVGSRGTAKHALYLGLTTTITHTAGVFALGLVTLLASEYIVPERLFPWMSLLSGVLVAGIGLSLFFSRLRGASIFSNSIHEHKHDHDHDHEHAHDHHDHHHEDDRHSHDHHDRSHLPPGADGSPVTWRSLLGLGISGGILPCPSALVVLLSAIALNRIAFGLLLVLVFSLGLAGALTTVGWMLVYARRFFDRVTMQSRLIRFLPAASALIVMAAGIGVTLQALTQLGILRV